MQDRELHRQRSTYAPIGLQRQWCLPWPDSVDVLDRFVRYRRQRKVPGGLYVDFVPHRPVLCIYRRLHAKEGERDRKHVHDRGRVYIDPLLISRRYLLRYGLHGAMPDLQQQHRNVHASLGPARGKPFRMRGLNRHHLRWALQQYVRQLLFSTRGNHMLGSNLLDYVDTPIRQDLPRERWCLRYSHPLFGAVSIRL